MADWFGIRGELMLRPVALNWNIIFSFAVAALISPGISIVAQVGIAPIKTPSKTYHFLIEGVRPIRLALSRNLSNCISLTIHYVVSESFTFFQLFVQGRSNGMFFI
jgi:hypothetical protein